MHLAATSCMLLATLLLASQASAKNNIQKLLDQFELNEKTAATSTPKPIKFSYQNCGPTVDPFQLTTLSVSPDPLKFPGNVTVNGAVNISHTLNAPLTMSLKLIKIIGIIKLEIPCVDNFGSCTYADVCSMLPTPDNCPEFFKTHGIPCTCPFTAGSYSVKNLQLEVDVPEKIPPGQYNIIANFQNKELGHVGCVNIDLTLG